MHSWLRLLIVCLMAVALPAQGHAAASLQHCGARLGGQAVPAGAPAQQPTHAGPAGHSSRVDHGDHGSPVGHAGHGGHAGHEAAAPGDPTLHGPDGARDAGPGPVADAGEVTAHHAPGVTVGGHGCSACAACCAAIGVPAAALQMPTVWAAPERPTPVPASSISFLTAGPERPPRTILG